MGGSSLVDVRNCQLGPRETQSGTYEVTKASKVKVDASDKKDGRDSAG